MREGAEAEGRGSRRPWVAAPRMLWQDQRNAPNLSHTSIPSSVNFFITFAIALACELSLAVRPRQPFVGMTAGCEGGSVDEPRFSPNGETEPRKLYTPGRCSCKPIEQKNQRESRAERAETAVP